MSLEKVLFSFGTREYYASLNALSLSAKNIGKVDKVLLFRERDIPKTFYEEQALHFQHKRGFGYWVWKPYFITKLLGESDKDAIFIYSDAGNEVISDLSELYKICQGDKKGVVLFDNRDTLSGDYVWKNYKWTKSDCFNLMGLTEDKYINGNQVNAAYILFRKTEFSTEFFNEYLEYAKNFNIISDANNITPDFNNRFFEHRHDQSILSLLSIKHNITILKDPSQTGESQKFDHDRRKYLRRIRWN